jgi:murein DD-endopeptidase MepM/ murein hydrolase activator NlpD
MKKFFLLFSIPFILFGYQVEIKEWGSNHTFYSFLKKHNIPFSIYYTLPKKVQKDLGAIPKDSDVYLLKDGNVIKQALIPFNDEKQLQIIKKGDKYITKIVPIRYTTTEKVAKINVKNFLSYDVYQNTKNPYLSQKLVNIFSDRVNFRVLPKDSVIDVYYKVKSRFGKTIGTDVIYAKISNKYYNISAYKYTDGRYYDDGGRSLKGMFLAYPMRFRRISSPFGRRYHPILHKWRMHDGIDLVNRVGTPIHTVADGKVVYRGWMRGYGNVVEVKHRNGYLTLYGHLKGFAHIRVGQYVRQGQTIAYMGNTGLSTGPHLHFGVMHNGRWINPLKIKQQAKTRLYGKKRKQFLAYVSQINEQLNNKVAMK